MTPAENNEVVLADLIELFYPTPASFGHCTEISASHLSPPVQRLLAHDHHMTVTLEEFHRCPVDVQVLQHRRDGVYYSRKILLTRQSDHHVVMFGIVRLNLSVMTTEVRQEIESQKIPLGRVLIDHDVMREVKLLRLFEITASENLAGALNIAVGEQCQGRTALIYCDSLPAIELLEIVR